MGEVNKLYQDLNGKPWAEQAELRSAPAASNVTIECSPGILPGSCGAGFLLYLTACRVCR